MATITRERLALSASLLSGAPLAWAYAFAATWLVAGIHLDAWAHAHRPGLETFFTPWHAVLYSGFGVCTMLTLAVWIAHGRAMPTGYGVSAAGVLLFMGGAVGDLVWHETLGIEVGIEALLSPTHLMLATGIALIAAGPLRAASRATAPALISGALILAMPTFFTQFIQPGGRPWPLAGNAPADPVFRVEAVSPDFPVFPDGVPSADIAIILGIGGILVATALLVTMALNLLRRWELPMGAFTLILGLNGALLGLMRSTPWWILVALAGGVAMDALYAALKPRLGGWRTIAFAAASPAALWIAYFATLAIVGGIWWSVHAWTGAILMAAIAGASLALAFPSASGVGDEPLGRVR